MFTIRWAVVARPQRGGRDLPEQFTFTTFCDWIRHELEAELERRWEIDMNGVGVPDVYAEAAGWPSAAALLRSSFNNRSRHYLCPIQTDASIHSATAPKLTRLTPTQLGFRILDWEVPIIYFASLSSYFILLVSIKVCCIRALYSARPLKLIRCKISVQGRSQ